MPIADLHEYSDLDRAIEKLLAAPVAQRLTALRGIFVEKLDFTPSSGTVVLHHADLPPSADIAAERDGVNVVLVQLPAGVRLNGKNLTTALKEIGRTLTDVFLVAVDSAGAEWQFVYPAQRGGREVLRRMVVVKGQPRRTVVEQLAGIYKDTGRVGIRQAIDNAYDVEAVTKKFFAEYRRIFDKVRDLVTGLPDDEERRLFCQTLMNRLMFLYFLQRKGWLVYNGDADYLNALWRGYATTPVPERGGGFYRSRLRLLFFTALANELSLDHDRARDIMTSIIGTVPFLNGGLFAETDLDKRADVTVPDEAIDLILHELFARFNFTIAESTPYDVEVAVDPEMLGKVFEELVTGRHETGSYYTPRPVVSFMCREALKGYLTARVDGLTPEATAAFVDEYDVSSIPFTRAGDVLNALEQVTVVDPACGSGAYLLGMLHELVELQRLLWNSDLIAGAKELYDLKLNVIERNVYGVDIDRFAVNIAMLRLWLSLVVEYDGPAKDLPPLPNLDYKIARGDSLTAPDPTGSQQLALAHELIVAFRDAKGTFLHAHGEEKRMLRDRIDALRHDISAMPRSGVAAVAGFDWAVEFAEVFERGGFDVVLANPPYVRQELIKDLKPALKAVYGDLYSGTADLYVYFYYRAIQLLRQHGMLVFISSNKWFRANYGVKLRKYIAGHLAIRGITDFGDLPVFESATAYPMIFAAQKSDAVGYSTIFTQVKSLKPPYPDVRALVEQEGQVLPSDAISGESWALTSNASSNRVRQMKAMSIPLSRYFGGQIYRGIVTGFNTAFAIDRAKRAELIAGDANSAQIIKPFATGKNIRRWFVNHQDKWLIFTRRGIRIDDYPCVKAHLDQWHTELEPKPHNWPANKKWPGRKPGSYKWYEIQDEIAYYATFDRPKIVFPDIAVDSRFAFDVTGSYLGNTTYFIPTDDLYLLGVLNSSAVMGFYVELSAQVRGGYLRFFTQYVEQIPIPDAPPADRTAIASLVQKCLDAKGQGPEVAAWEAEINARVARLYGLTEADVAAIEGPQASATEGEEATA